MRTPDDSRDSAIPRPVPRTGGRRESVPPQEPAVRSDTEDVVDPAAAADRATTAPASSERSADTRLPGDPWRSVEELDGRAGPAHDVRAAAEAPSRREFLRVLGSSAALASLAACRQRERDEMVPYVRAPHHAIQTGQAIYVATALLHEGFASPVLAESHMGRPIKIEGNPEHPESLGATDVFAQAAVLRLYDPDRSRTVRRGERIATWEDFEATWRQEHARLLGRQGAGLHVLTGRACSPTFDAALQRLLQAFPAARWFRHEPIDDENARLAARTVLGTDLTVRPHLDRARRVLSFDCDFLFESPARVRNAHEFARSRAVWRPASEGMLRLYAVESTLTLTGANADHRLAVRATELLAVARHVAALLGIGAVADAPALDEAKARWLAAAVDALRQAGPTALVLAGRSAPPGVHALAMVMNAAFGALGTTATLHEPVDRSPAGEPNNLVDLARALNANEVETLVVLGSNPLYTAPADLELERAVRTLPGLTVHAGEYRDETAHACAWHLPLAHDLECWQDARSPEGRVTILQPLIEPLHRGRAPHVVLDLLAGGTTHDDRELVRTHWREALDGEGAFDDRWRAALLRGWLPGTEAPAVAAEPDVSAALALADARAAQAEPDDALELVFRPDATIWDGRHANNAWLQELPKPLTTLTWDNAVLLGPALADARGLTTGDVVRLRLGSRSVDAPVQILPGQPDGSVCVTLGYGRRAAGRVAEGAGFDAYRLRTCEHLWSVHGLVLERVGRHVELAHTQHHHRMEGRHHLRTGTLEQFRADPALIVAAGSPRPHEERPSLLPPWDYDGQQWGMAIDLAACIGCGACTIACQAENDIPVVGREEVRRGREMHWIRVDRYFEGPLAEPAVRFQPVPCMHCERAPCELVCPVGATQHSHDGLNDMIYNRCVGTRYCSNNCPYKVRRFNFFDYAARAPDLVELRRNPEVTSRSRGVMEKCTYCVQRVRKAGVHARLADRPILDGEVRTACQQVCPAHAISFGDVADPDTEVSRWKAQPHGYGMLAELNTQPRTTYLANLVDLDPALAALVRERGPR